MLEVRISDFHNTSDDKKPTLFLRATIFTIVAIDSNMIVSHRWILLVIKLDVMVSFIGPTVSTNYTRMECNNRIKSMLM